MTIEQLKKIGNITDVNANKYIAEINNAMQEFKINTVRREAMFIAQILHESGHLTAVKENLNYSALRLTIIFPKYFPNLNIANQYAGNPEKIANKVYANRMGNGAESTGDGYRFCGRGLIQITGKSNYQKLSMWTHRDISDVEYLETPEGASYSAGWFWNEKELNKESDESDILGCTRKINGGTNGLRERVMLYAKALSVLK